MGTSEPTVSVSVVSISDRMIEDVAHVAGTTPDDVRAYLADSERQDPAIFRAFERHQVFPIGKFPERAT